MGKRARRRSRLFGVLPLYGAYPTIAVVRYDGDPDTFAALAESYLIRERGDGYGPGIDPPDPRLFRCVPCGWTDDYGWMLHEETGPGRGVWLGSRLTIAGHPEGPVGRNWIVPLPTGRRWRW